MEYNPLASKQDYERLLINVLRGVAIFFMIWGHLIQHICVGFNGFDTPVHRVIYSFHMPLFMLISGYLFYYSSTKYSFDEILLRKAKTLLYPLVSCKILYFFLVTCLMDLILHHDYHSFFSGEWAQVFSGPWFLWSLFAAIIPVATAVRFKKYAVISIIILFGGFVFVALFPNADRNIFMYPYFVIGFLFSKYQFRIPNWIKYSGSIIASVLFFIMIFYYKKKHYIYISGIYYSEYSLSENISINIFRYAIGLFGSIFIVMIVSLLVSIATKKNYSSKGILFAFAGLGKYSLHIYIISSVVESWLILLLTSYIPNNNFFVNHLWVYSLLYTPMIAIVYITGLFWLAKLLETKKFGKYIFAR